MSTNEIWGKLSASKKYREEFVASQVKQGIPFQIHSMRKGMNLSQEGLARRSEVTQGVVSRAENPSYGNLTLNTIIRIAAGFDVAFIGNFVPFSELVDWYEGLSESSVQVEPFERESRGQSERRPYLNRLRRFRRKSKITHRMNSRPGAMSMGGGPPLGNMERRQLTLPFNERVTGGNVVLFPGSAVGAGDSLIGESQSLIVTAGGSSWNQNVRIHI